MKQVFLTSSVHSVAYDLAKKTVARKLLFIPTAAELDYSQGQEPDWMHDDRQALLDAGFTLTDFTFSQKSQEEVDAAFNSVEGMYVEGGNTFYLLQEMQKSGAIKLIQQKVNEGFLYIGTSAGSIVAGPDILYIRKMENLQQAPNVNGSKGLGLTNVVIFPHWGSPHFEKAYRSAVLADAYQSTNPILILSDNQYLHIFDEGSEVVSVK